MTLQERIDELEAELAILRAEVKELRRQRALLLESQTHWMSVAGGRC
jgi:prefoldin subunit 5